jgi:hypothetical protein
MSTALREITRWLGKPVECYRFTRQSLVWRYTSADESITINDETYTPLAITRDKIQDSTERKKRQLKITLPRSADICSLWRPYPPSDVVAVTLLQRHRGETDFELAWYGRVLQPHFTDAECELTCDPSSGGARTHGLMLRWTRGCPLALYSQGRGMCNLNPADFSVPAILTGVSGLTLTAAEFSLVASGRLAGGYVEWQTSTGLIERRSITNHAGSQINVDYGAEDLAVGLALTAYHGCAHNYADCDSKGNGDNYGGCTKLPNQNPFGGEPLWW